MTSKTWGRVNDFHLEMLKLTFCPFFSAKNLRTKMHFFEIPCAPKRIFSKQKIENPQF